MPGVVNQVAQAAPPTNPQDAAFEAWRQERLRRYLELFKKTSIKEGKLQTASLPREVAEHQQNVLKYYGSDSPELRQEYAKTKAGKF
jgi:hypothetical protein